MTPPARAGTVSRAARLAACWILLFFPGIARSADDAPPAGSAPSREAMKPGERIYRDGILPSGEPMMAVAMGDIPVDGRMFTCDDCHQRSGIGSVEGTVITWPTNGKELYIPRRSTGAFRPAASEEEKESPRRELPEYWKQIQDVRPAYTDETLARVLRTGVDPAGRKLNPVMPRYILNARDMPVLIHYLKNLSLTPGPGVDNAAITFATVVTGGVPAGARASMLATLRSYVEAHNSQSRHEERRAKSGAFFKTEMFMAYRRIKLLVWELAGPPETWRGQLEARYREEPVFALLGGMASAGWAPIHRFCEENRIPCIFPITDLPMVSESDWYTLYFSKGPYQEGESAANYLDRIENLPPDAKVFHFLRKGERAEAAARGFEEAWERSGRPPTVRRVLGEEETLTGKMLGDLAGSDGPAVLLLWLGPGDLPALEALGKKGADGPKFVFLSSTLLDGKLSAVPDAARDRVYVTYPSILPEESGRRLDAVRGWLKSRKVPATDLEIQARVYFLGMMLSETIKHLRSEYFRDYFLEGYDMMVDQDYAIAVYPRLTFGTGQRYASKGCYIVQLGKGQKPALIRKSDWVIH